MTREEREDVINFLKGYLDEEIYTEKCRNAHEMAIKSLEQEPCEDAISREEAIDACNQSVNILEATDRIKDLPPVTPHPKIGHCKDCKYFEYNSMAKVDGIPLIVAHEICNKWGDGCKSKEDGYCFLFEPKMQEVEE